MNAHKRGYALLLCISLILVLFVSSAFLIQEADHDCCGEDCPICETIAVNIQLIRTLGLALLIPAAILFLRRGQAVRCRHDRHIRFFTGTLVSWKVRLDD